MLPVGTLGEMVGEALFTECDDYGEEGLESFVPKCGNNGWKLMCEMGSFE